MTLFLCQSPFLGTYLWLTSRPSVVEGGGCCARKVCCAKLVVVVDLNGWCCAGVCKTILEQYIYCTKTNTKPNFQSGYQVCKLLGTRSQKIIWEYDLATVIAIRELTQHLTWEMGSYIFTSMSQLEVASTTWVTLFKYTGTWIGNESRIMYTPYYTQVNWKDVYGNSFHL